MNALPEIDLNVQVAAVKQYSKEMLVKSLNQINKPTISQIGSLGRTENVQRNDFAMYAVARSTHSRQSQAAREALRREGESEYVHLNLEPKIY